MAKAVWNGVVLAESDKTIVVGGNHYFPPEAVNWEHFEDSEAHTTCYSKGLASYYHIKENGNLNKDAAWYYQNPSEAAHQIKGYVAFWRGVKVES